MRGSTDGRVSRARPRLGGSRFRLRFSSAIGLVALLCTFVSVGVVVPSTAAEVHREAPTDPGRWLEEFDLGNPNGLPNDIVSTADGTVWVSVFGDRTVVRLDHTGAIIGTYPLSGSPSSVEADDEGGVWATEIASNKIAHISAEGVVREYPLPTANSFPAHVWDAGKQIYFTASGTGSLGRLTESTGAVEEWFIPGAVQLSELDGIGENVWVVDEGAGVVWMIDRAGAVPRSWSVPGVRRIELDSVEADGVHGIVQTTSKALSFVSTQLVQQFSSGSPLQAFTRVGSRYWSVDASYNTLTATGAGRELTFSLPTGAQIIGGASSETRFVWLLDRGRGRVIRFDALASVLPTRIAGSDRYEVAANMALRFAGLGAKTVFVASGEKFADALSVGPLAGRLGGPVLLATSRSLPDTVRRALIRLNPERVVVVGGRASISDDVISVIKHELPTSRIERVEGADRYEVSRALLTGLDAPTDRTALYIATGAKFPDALSSTPAAVRAKTGVLLVNGVSATLSDAEMAIIRKFASAGATIKIAGGPASVSTGIEEQVASVGKVVRFGGVDRYAVSVAISIDAFPTSVDRFLASGTTFADALTGGPLAGMIGAPLLLAQRECIPVGALSLLAAGGRDMYVLGGENSLSPAVFSLTSCS
jgi:putative cell wall-binding protein